MITNEIGQLWRQLKIKDSFVQNSAFMFSASAWGILLQFIFAPILSRIYDPEVYGLFGIFNSWVVVIGVFVTLGYNQAFVLPKEESRFRALLRLSIKSSLIISGLVFLVFLIGWRWINPIFSAEKLGWLTVFVGPMVLLLALDKIIIDWSVRVKAFKQQSLLSIPLTFGSKAFNVGYGWGISNTVEGLIITNGVLLISRIYLYLTRVIPSAFSFIRHRVFSSEIKDVAQEYRNYPRLVMWSNVLQTASNYLPIVLLPAFLHSTEPAGLFSYSLLVLDLPARMLGAGVTRVFYQKATELVTQSKEALADAAWRLFKVLGLLVVAPLIILGIFGEWLYGWVFGGQWQVAGLLAAILGGYYFFRLLSSPISTIFNVLRKEKALFTFQTILFVFRLGALVIACICTSNLVTIIVVYSAANALTYMILIGWIFQLCGKYTLASLGLSAGVFVISLTLVIAARSLIIGTALSGGSAVNLLVQ